jgi:hypothetical protein
MIMKNARPNAMIYPALCLAALLMPAAGGAWLWAQAVHLRFHQVPRALVENRLLHVPQSNDGREAELKNLFASVGCKQSEIQEQPVRRHDPPNVTCTLPGITPSLIIVGAHLDHVTKGAGIVDDWSGAAMLPSLYASLETIPRKHTFLFTAFTDEEKGLVGSRFYVRKLDPDDRLKIQAMVNLECLGLSTSEVWTHHADPTLLSGLTGVAKALRLPLTGVNVENVGRDDAMSFRDDHIPTITIHSVTNSTLRVLHSWNDAPAAINQTDYYQTYNLVAAYLAFLDLELPVTPRQPK